MIENSLETTQLAIKNNLNRFKDEEDPESFYFDFQLKETSNKYAILAGENKLNKNLKID